MGRHPFDPVPLSRLLPHPASPERTHAVIIGIESYHAGRDWDLDGPLNDALAIRSWLHSRCVPEAQIHLHVAALEHNQHKLLEDQGQGDGLARQATDQAIRKTFDALRQLPPAQAELLLIFWAGHGVISRDRHCLLLSEATNTDQVNYSLENIRYSFSSSNCSGFPQQIFLLDTCRSFHCRPADPPPSIELPSGAPSRRSQFIFSASQQGEAAINLGSEQCGLFTKMLLDRLRGAPEDIKIWPPDMEAIAQAVQDDFRERNGMAASVSQTPVYTMIVDWQGNASSEDMPAPEFQEPEAILSTLDASNQLAWLLARHLGHQHQRDAVMRDLQLCGETGQEIYARTSRRADPLGDYEQIIDICSRYKEGLNLIQRITLHALGKKTARTPIEQAFLRLQRASAAEEGDN